jgi:uncharacterized protein DUF6152
MKVRVTAGVLFSVVAALLLAAAPTAHHEILAKFDDKKPMSLTGIVTSVDWANPHVHIFMTVRTGNENVNWAIELASPIDLNHSGWNRESVQPGESIKVDGIAARNGSRQVWANSVVTTANGRQVLNVRAAAPPPPLGNRPTPRWPDGQPRLGTLPGVDGYWGYPSVTVLTENNAQIGMTEHGLLKNIGDAAKVAPMQPWALSLYRMRQQRFLQDDPMFLNCKPPGGVRQYQSPYGLQFVEDRDRKRIFVLIGSGNRNYRIIYTDGRGHAGQVGGDDDNPLYYGRAVGTWEKDTLVVDTRGFNEDFWFTNGGLPHTEQLKLVERFTRENLDTLKYEVTIDDPGAYTRPWSSSWTLRWVADEILPAHLCQDNRP